MKRINKFLLPALVIFSMMLVFSCDLEVANINPNDPTEVPANVLLPYTQESLARLMAGTGQVMSGIFMQYYEGIDNHPRQVQIYILNEALYVDWDWNDYYDGPMINLQKMIDVSIQDSAHYYTGIGKILMALCLGNMTSLWGDIPASQALNGSLNRSPVFDSQESIYEKIQLMLDEGIQSLEKTNYGIEPAADDLIFKGNIEKWKSTANALKARYYLHLTKRTGDLSYNPAEKALESAEKAFISSNDDMEFIYGYSAAEYNPFYSFARLKYIIPNNSFTSKMSALNDPRRNFLYKKKFGVATIEDSYFTSPNSPVHLMTYHELKFIEAEARLRINENDPEAQVALQEAVRASIVKISSGTLDTTIVNNYVNANAVLTGTFDAKLQTLISQKYYAMFATIESWTDFRRTGYPVLTPNDGGDHNQNPGGAIPRRFAYPQNERLYNTNFPTYLPNLQDKIWLDLD